MVEEGKPVDGHAFENGGRRRVVPTLPEKSGRTSPRSGMAGPHPWSLTRRSGGVLVPLHRPCCSAHLDSEPQLLARIAGYVAGGGPWTTSLDSAAWIPNAPSTASGAGETPSVAGRYGKDASIRFPRCRSCGDRFSERKGTPLSRSPLTKEKATPSSDTSRRGVAPARPNA